MSTHLSKRVSLTRQIQKVVNNAEKEFPKEQNLSSLADDVQELEMDLQKPLFYIRETIESIVNKTSSDALIIMMNDVGDMIDQLEKMTEKQSIEYARKRSFTLQDMIIMNRERLDWWTKQWEEVIWDSDDEKRTYYPNKINRIRKRLDAQVNEFEHILNNISGELRAEWAKDYFGR